MDNYQNSKWAVIKSEIADLSHELKQVPPKALSAWDRSALAKVVDIQRATEQDEYEAALKRVFELAGLNYEIEQQNFWRRYHARAKRKQS
jgi:hypothetical protein